MRGDGAYDEKIMLVVQKGGQQLEPFRILLHDQDGSAQNHFPPSAHEFPVDRAGYIPTIMDERKGDNHAQTI
ncbi:hypothetical protein XYCOK13_31980 [Xylanibacillus composti]|uniref:Uncharacterized protein n=1 Tax=Xylanibacillus composti TaxID=1572762 RepID=A0A8J4H7G9_9BACL|nr:hypothetical protein XYCOK13_31980 [Xylanibacillus composti]